MRPRLLSAAALVSLMALAGCEGGFGWTGDPNVAELYPRGTESDYDDQGFFDPDGTGDVNGTGGVGDAGEGEG